MTPMNIYTSEPSDYAVCIHEDCPMADTCLHRQVYAKLLESRNYLRMVNPQRCSKNAQCEFYRDSKPVRFARGFINFQKNMFPGQYQTFMMTLIGKFGRNGYFDRRRGTKPLSPKEQEVVMEALRNAGVTNELKFDAYEELINWYD